MKRILMALLLAIPAVAMAEGTMYVQSARAKILTEPKFGAAEVSTVTKGTVVSVVESRGRWHRVALDGGKAGWISKFLVSAAKPLNKKAISVLGGKDAEVIDTNARRRASAVTTAGAARGLTAAERRRVSDADRLDFRALAAMEEISVSDDEALSFLAEGITQ